MGGEVREEVRDGEAEEDIPEYCFGSLLVLGLWKEGRW
jgi:hypothetical protein